MIPESPYYPRIAKHEPLSSTILLKGESPTLVRSATVLAGECMHIKGEVPHRPRTGCHQAGRFVAIEHYLKACAGKPDCREMKMNWVISMSEQSGFPTYIPVLFSME